MDKLIDFFAYPVQIALNILLQDKSTKKNIIRTTDLPQELSINITDKNQITSEQLPRVCENIIQPRIAKVLEDQAERTRKKGEVFTPAWICNLMNNACDEEWFHRKNIFNVSDGHSWTATLQPVTFPENKTWKQYIDSRRMEITCGEAPYLVSRYDTSTGEYIPPCHRIGILDRKIRIVNENTADFDEWFYWTLRAFQSVYGYEYQGDSLLIARVNLLMTFEEYYRERWQKEPEEKEILAVADVIAWNLWQMDGLKAVIPFGKPYRKAEQSSLYDPKEAADLTVPVPCKIFDWRENHSSLFRELTDGKSGIKFDFVVGNPPYQDETLGDNKGYAPPVYHKFLNESYKIANVVEMIHPARFLFNAGSTPKVWNKQMLSDPHIKVTLYEQNSSNIFTNTDIKGGVAVTYRDAEKEYGEIGTFTPYKQLNTIIAKTHNEPTFAPISTIVVTRTAYRLTPKMHADHPEALGQLSKGHAYDMSTNIFQRLPQIFFEEKPDDGRLYIKMIGRESNKRVSRFVRKEYVNDVCNLEKYKIIMPKANGSGQFGEVISAPFIAGPLTGTTETFLSLGMFETEGEAKAALKYIKTKYARALLGVLKTTQDLTPGKWGMVPLQDFTLNSDIDWSGSVADIDRQLYKKYRLSYDEISFIEGNVKVMI